MIYQILQKFSNSICFPMILNFLLHIKMSNFYFVSVYREIKGNRSPYYILGSRHSITKDTKEFNNHFKYFTRVWINYYRIKIYF